ncbi:hypothetical protein A8V01_18310 [Novosphingobium guangzhouense]|uniref:Uncharacterized protein n=1 Tax=Novosphingobium guangzhouense TaxID=1850347 RepID=A0A2K2G1D9_9SPHN|nr:hypothetical protein A8V01_18310 [Novosphingobium guangzhouense]
MKPAVFRAYRSLARKANLNFFQGENFSMIRKHTFIALVCAGGLLAAPGIAFANPDPHPTQTPTPHPTDHPSPHPTDHPSPHPTEHPTEHPKGR